MRLRPITRTFFKRVKNATLKRYFTHKGVLLEYNFSKIPETKIEPIWELYIGLEDNKRTEIESEFSEIQALACNAGINAILDEARRKGKEELAEILAEQADEYEQVFWIYFNRYDYWAGAYSFCYADSISYHHWSECKTLTDAKVKTDSSDLKDLEKKLGEYFHKQLGRGKYCHIEVYVQRGDLDYFFIYTEDSPKTNIEWENGDFKRTTRIQAIETIITYSQKEQKIRLYMPSSKGAAREHVRSLFADAVLGLKMGEFAEKTQVYDLTPLFKDKNTFKFESTSGIKAVFVKKLKLAVHGSSERITLEADPTENPDAVYELMAKICTIYPQNELSIKQARIEVHFYPEGGKNKINTCTFNLSWPNSCSIRNPKHDAPIRQMLIDSGIDV